MSSAQVLVRTPGAAASRYSMLLTDDPDEVRAAQRLRHRVFADERGAAPRAPVPGLDVDRFDAHCDHLLVREDATGEVVGTCRLLPPERAALAGGLHSDGGFDLTALAPLRSSLVEVGRACVHPDHRDASVVEMVWAGIAGYLVLSGHRWVTGRVGIPLDDGGRAAASVYDRVLARHLAPPEYVAQPVRPWDPRGVRRRLRAQPPPLLHGYLRLGAWVCGPPAYDAESHCADFLVLLGLDHIDPRYLRRLVGGRRP
ncbi:GNAT family N-acetyltransferase [Pseudonocardia humida]|uniref:GNAT family N-acetyltransferase n=1 Tax=Pseudonocardia humida TaxID=2800819 RepID=A0ABT1ABC4_9PSEU|nr:GNAT family N-acyltransferase [Pseudonocardia humida]MCO1660231.1 GNAT family N-acetyltransferase [Pseudonocardia humida]